jgi:endonuclease/exonuclease/phosphatase family metal-dependent hydrolase
VNKITNRTLLILNILSGAALLLAYLAPVVNPARFFLPALFGLAYPYLLLLNLIFFIFWLIRLKKEVLISLIIILLGWNPLHNLLPFNFGESRIPENADHSRLFKVLSYNVRGLNVYRWADDPQVKQEIFDFLENQDPDLVCLQEYYTSSRRGESHSDVSKQLQFLPRSAVYFPSDPANRQGFGIATFSKYPILKMSRIPFNTTFNAAMYTDILFQSDTIRVFNVHLQSIRFEKDDYAFMDTARLTYSNEQMNELRAIGSRLKTAFSLRSEQAKVIANYIRDSPYPVVVMGDFNDTPQSYAYRKIRRGIHDAFRLAGRGFGNTYSGDLPSFRIDYILHSKELIPYEFRRIKIDHSDHFPITTGLYLQEEPIPE